MGSSMKWGGRGECVGLAQRRVFSPAEIAERAEIFLSKELRNQGWLAELFNVPQIATPHFVPLGRRNSGNCRNNISLILPPKGRSVAMQSLERN